MMMPRGYYRKRGERGKKSHQDSKQKLLLPIISQQSPAISHCTHVSPINLSLEITRGVLFISPSLSIPGWPPRNASHLRNSKLLPKSEEGNTLFTENIPYAGKSPSAEEKIHLVVISSPISRWWEKWRRKGVKATEPRKKGMGFPNK